MNIVVFEDRGVPWLEPLTLTRPAGDLWCGGRTLLQRQAEATGADAVGLVVRPELAALASLEHPGVAVNETDWSRRAGVAVNARWLPGRTPLTDTTTPRVALAGDEVAYVVGPPAPADVTPEALDEWAAHCKATLPHCAAEGRLIKHAWELVEHNPDALRQDLDWFARQPGFSPVSAEVATLGPRDAFLVHRDAFVEPFVVADTRQGPVILDRGAVVHSFSRLEGPCYVGPESVILGGKLRGGTLGPQCRVGGEFEASIVQGFSNKYHDGFLGHSYVGSWVNLAAGTQVSDLRNDYGQIGVSVAGHKVLTGLNKVGAFLGDHTKTGLNTMLNTGTMAGVFCNLLPSGALLPKTIPSFCQYDQGQLHERSDLRQLFGTAATVMRRRGRELTAAHTEYLIGLYEQTAPSRRQRIREAEQRRLRRSV
jgi:UDP-N-acetylglucosamine diphosphorylase/glucosamine-1-phosphate N-acetyltransferase